VTRAHPDDEAASAGFLDATDAPQPATGPAGDVTAESLS
jgi:hypothetical protein